jgi:hypothetical protein
MAASCQIRAARWGSGWRTRGSEPYRPEINLTLDERNAFEVTSGGGVRERDMAREADGMAARGGGPPGGVGAAAFAAVAVVLVSDARDLVTVARMGFPVDRTKGDPRCHDARAAIEAVTASWTTGNDAPRHQISLSWRARRTASLRWAAASLR